jgi:hypothetical protein
MFDQQDRYRLQSAVLTAIGVTIEEWPQQSKIVICFPPYVPTEIDRALADAIRLTLPTWLRIEVRRKQPTIVDARAVVDTEGSPPENPPLLLKLLGPMAGERDE